MALYYSVQQQRCVFVFCFCEAVTERTTINSKIIQQHSCIHLITVRLVTSAQLHCCANDCVAICYKNNSIIETLYSHHKTHTTCSWTADTSHKNPTSFFLPLSKPFCYIYTTVCTSHLFDLWSYILSTRHGLVFWDSAMHLALPLPSIATLRAQQVYDDQHPKGQLLNLHLGVTGRAFGRKQLEQLLLVYNVVLLVLK